MTSFARGGSRNWGLAIALGCASLLALAIRPAVAADATFVGRLALAVDDDVAARLGLSDAVKSQLDKIIDDRETAALELSLKLKGLSHAEQEAKLAPFRAESEQQGLKLLTDAQRKQLETIRVERQGMATLAEPTVIDRLKLSAEQQATVASLLDQRAGALDKAADAAAKRTIHADYERKLSAVLTPAQRTAWDDLAANGSGAAESKTAVAGGKETAPAAEKSPDAKATTTVPSTAKSPSAAAKKPAEPRGNPEELKFNFRFAPWKEVLEWFAQQADLSLVMDSPPPGTFNYQDNKTYNPAEAIDLLNSVLLTKGYTLVRRDRLLMLVDLRDGVPANLVPTVSLEELDKRGKYELVSVVFRPVKLSPEEAEAEIRKLLGPQGSIVVLAKAGQLVVTETAGRLRTIRDVLKAIEDPQGTFTDRLQTFTFKYATPTDALTVIKQLLNIPADKNTSSDGSLRLALDASSGKLLVSGKADAVKRVEDVIKMIDVPGQAGSLLAETPQLEIYSITSADPTSVLQVLQTLLAGSPEVRLTIDPKTGNLIALARPSQHATIRATLAQMQRDARQVEVLHLHTLDPQLAMVSINKVFAAEGDAGPKIEADAAQHQLIVRGTEAQINQIRGLLEKMGEVPFSAVGDAKEHVRMIPLSGRAGRTAIEQMEQLWPTLHKNKIRVVAPTGAASEGANPIEEKGTPNQRQAIPGIRQVAPPGDPAAHPPTQFLPTQPSAPPAGVQPPPSAPQPPASAVPEQPAPVVPPQASPAKPEGRNTQVRRVRAIFVDQKLDEPAGDNPPATTPKPTPSVKSPDAKTPDAKAPAATGEPAPIIITLTPNGIMIASDDTQALDDFESMLTALTSKNSSGREFTVFYLKYAKAAAVGELLGQIFGGSTGSSSGGGSLLGNIAGAALGGDAGGLVGSLLGGGGGGDSAGPAHVTATGPISIVPDSRLNALVVQANSADLDTVEQLLKVLDQKNGPEEVSVVARPQLIPIRYTSADTIAAVVKQVYQDRLATPSNAQRQPSPVEMFQMLRGGGRGGRGGGARGARGNNPAQNAAEDETPKMTVGVDSRTNSLIISAPDPLFNEVKALVAQLDQPDPESNQTMQVVTVKRTSPEAVQQALSAMMGNGVRASVVPAATTSSSIPGNGTPNGTVANQRGDNSRGGYGSNYGSGGNSDQSRRRADFFNALQQGFGGNGGGGSQGGGGFQGSSGGFQGGGGFRGNGGQRGGGR